MSAIAIDAAAIALALGAGAVTYMGGLIGLRLGAHRALLLGFTAGVVMGIALFDLLPEAVEAGRGLHSFRALAGGLAAGMMLYLLVGGILRSIQGGERLLVHLGPAGLTLHSLLDGAGIAIAFRFSTETGIAVAIAVIAHDIADGINTVGLGLAGGRPAIARRWLAANAAAPLVGLLLGLVIRPDRQLLPLLLAAFAGALLYLGACEVMPRSRSGGATLKGELSTIAGMLLAFTVMRFA